MSYVNVIIAFTRLQSAEKKISRMDSRLLWKKKVTFNENFSLTYLLEDPGITVLNTSLIINLGSIGDTSSIPKEICFLKKKLGRPKIAYYNMPVDLHVYVNLNVVLKFVASVFFQTSPAGCIKVLCNFQLTRLTWRILKHLYNNTFMEIFTNRHRLPNNHRMRSETR